MPSRDAYFQSGGQRLRYRDEGAGRAVVFLHGWTLDLEGWQPQAAAFAPVLRIVRLDRRGFGLSGGEPSLEADIGDLAALLDHLRLSRVGLVGASQGARLALAYALAAPERVGAIVLDGPPDETGAAGEDGVDVSLDEFRALVREQGLEAFRRAWRAHPLTRLHTADAGVRALLGQMLARYPGRDLLQTEVRRAPPVGAAALARIGLPALVVNGALDTPVRLRAGLRLARALPDARHVVLPGAGHLPNLDSPGAYNEALLDFFRLRARAAA